MTRTACAFLVLLFMSVAPGAHAEFLDCVFDGDFEDPGTTNAQALDALGLHNCARRTVDPPADTPLVPLTWSASAATVAQTYANGCFDVPSGLPYGENLYAIPADDPANAMQDAVSSWLGEQPYYSIANNKCTDPAPPDGNGTCDDYTQIVWKASIPIAPPLVGCARTFCTQHSPFAASPHWYFVVCEYLPASTKGERPY